MQRPIMGRQNIWLTEWLNGNGQSTMPDFPVAPLDSANWLEETGLSLSAAKAQQVLQVYPQLRNTPQYTEYVDRTLKAWDEWRKPSLKNLWLKQANDYEWALEQSMQGLPPEAQARAQEAGFGVVPQEKPRKSKGMFAKALDAGKNAFGTAMDGLAWASEETENVLGAPTMAAMDKLGVLDIPDGMSYWEASELFYDLIGPGAGKGFKRFMTPPVFQFKQFIDNPSFSTALDVGLDIAPLTRLAAAHKATTQGVQSRLNQFNADVRLGTSPEVLRAKYTHVWSDMVGKMIFDPLWLVGGLGMAPKGYKSLRGVRGLEELARGAGITKGAKEENLALRILKHGLVGGEGAPVNLYKTRGYNVLSNVPILGAPVRFGARTLGVPPMESVLQDALAAQKLHARQAYSRFTTGKGNIWSRWMSWSPQTHANDTLSNSTLWMQIPLNFEGTTPREFVAFMEGVITGNADAIPAKFGSLARDPDLLRLVHENFRASGITSLKDVKGLKRWAKTVEYAGAEAMDDPAMLHSIYAHVSDSTQASLARGAEAMFGIESGGYNGLIRKMFSIMRHTINVTSGLTRPGFDVVNFIENMGKGWWDNGLGYARSGAGPFRMFSQRQMRNMGMDVDAVKKIVADDNTLGAYTGVKAGGGKVGTLDAVIRAAEWPVWVASELDFGARQAYFVNGAQRFAEWNLDKMPPIPEHLAAKLSTEAQQALYKTVLSVVMTGDDSMRQLRGVLENGLDWHDSRAIVEDWLREQGLDDHGVKVFMTDFSELAEVINLGLRDVGDRDQFVAYLDDLRAELVDKIHYSRDEMMLEPVGRLRTGWNSSEVANLEAHLLRRESEALSDVSRFLRSAGVPVDHIPQVTDALEGYISLVREARQSLSQAMRNADGKATFETYLSQVKALKEERANMVQSTVEAVSGIKPEARAAVDDIVSAFAKADEETFTAINKLVQRINMAPNSRAAFADMWDELFDVITDLHNNEMRFRKSYLGIRPRSLFRSVRANLDDPSWFDATTLQTMEMLRFFDDKGEDILGLFDNPLSENGVGRLITDPTNKDDFMAWVDDLETAAADLRVGSQVAGREWANFGMLNYGRMFGFEEPLRWLFPYLTWPTRSMQRWALRFTASPGRAASIAHLVDAQERMNEDLPLRFKNTWRFPIPGMAKEMLAKYAGIPTSETEDALFFDPMRVFISPVQFQMEFDSPDKRKSLVGNILDTVGSIGPGPNPLLTRAIAMTAMSGSERDAWLRNNWFNSLPFGLPSTAAWTGIASMLGVDEDPANMQEYLMGKKVMPETVLREMLGVPQDEWDNWKIQRASGHIIASENLKIYSDLKSRGASREEIQQALQDNTTLWSKDILDKKGKKWEQARKLASSDEGLRGIGSWAIGMPIYMYTEGEKLQRGIDQIYEAAASTGRLEEFYADFPEYTIYHSATIAFDEPEEAKKELSTNAYWSEQGKVRAFWAPTIASLEGTVNAMEADEGVLNSEHGRFRLNAARAELAQARKSQREELAAVEAAFPFADHSPSLKRDPRLRALQTLENIYYEIETDDYSDVLEKQLAGVKDEETRQRIIADRQKHDRDRLLQSLPLEESSPDYWLNLSIARAKTQLQYERLISEAYGKADYDKAKALTKERDAMLEGLTDQAARRISRAEFERWLERNRKPPSPAMALYQRAQEQYGTWIAILDEGTGLSENERKRAAGIYRNAHPLIDRFYGNERDIAKRDPAAAALLNKMRSSYYELPDDDPEAKIDYLYRNLPDYNDIAKSLGLPPVDLQDWLPPDDERDDWYLPGTMPGKDFLEKLLNGRYSSLLN